MRSLAMYSTVSEVEVELTGCCHFGSQEPATSCFLHPPAQAKTRATKYHLSKYLSRCWDKASADVPQLVKEEKCSPRPWRDASLHIALHAWRDLHMCWALLRLAPCDLERAAYPFGGLDLTVMQQSTEFPIEHIRASHLTLS